MKRERTRLIFGCIGVLWLFGVAPLVWAAGGALLWEDRFDLTGGYDVADAVALQGSRLFVVGRGQVPSKNGYEDFDWLVRAYDRRSGALLWQDQADGGLEVAEAPHAVAVQGRYLVVVGAAGGDGEGDWWVRAYDAKTGHLRWQDRIVRPAGSEEAAAVVIKGHKAFVVGSRVRVYDLNRGKVIWEDPEVSGGSIAARGKSVFIAGSRNGDFFVRAYDSRTGRVQWEDLSDLSGGQDSANALKVHGHTVIAAGSAGTSRDFVVRAYEAGTGVLRWEDRLDTGGLDEASALAIKDRFAYVVGRVRASGTDDFIVRAYDIKTGTLRWEDIFDFGGNDSANAVSVSGGQVVAGGSLQEPGFHNHGILVRAYDAKSGRLQWTDQLVESQASGFHGVAGIGGQVYAVGSRTLDVLVRAYKAH